MTAPPEPVPFAQEVSFIPESAAILAYLQHRMQGYPFDSEPRPRLRRGTPGRLPLFGHPGTNQAVALVLQRPPTPSAPTPRRPSTLARPRSALRPTQSWLCPSTNAGPGLSPTPPPPEACCSAPGLSWPHSRHHGLPAACRRPFSPPHATSTASHGPSGTRFTHADRTPCLRRPTTLGMQRNRSEQDAQPAAHLQRQPLLGEPVQDAEVLP